MPAREEPRPARSAVTVAASAVCLAAARSTRAAATRALGAVGTRAVPAPVCRGVAIDRGSLFSWRVSLP